MVLVTKGLEEADEIYSGNSLAAAPRVRAVHSGLAWNILYSVNLSGPGRTDGPEQWRSSPRRSVLAPTLGRGTEACRGRNLFSGHGRAAFLASEKFN